MPKADGGFSTESTLTEECDQVDVCQIEHPSLTHALGATPARLAKDGSALSDEERTQRVRARSRAADLRSTGRDQRLARQTSSTWCGWWRPAL